jgi:hypothetical protein
MISKKNHRYYFTLQDLIDESGMSRHAARFRVAKYTGKGTFKVHSKLPPNNVHVYVSDIDPLVVTGEKTDNTATHIKPSFFNNPFNMKNAIDWRWRYEEIFN